jgi:thioredoxin reductase (NADPH)
VLIGPPDSADVRRLQGFLGRNGYPYHVVDATHDADAAALLEQYGEAPVIVVCPKRLGVGEPERRCAARCLGMVDTVEHSELFDVVVVGAGRPGLATAVYAASEGCA